jgi:hypothetical protein
VTRSGSLLRTRALRELHQSQSEANNNSSAGGLDDDEPAKVEEVKKQLQESVASYFDRLQEEEREKLKQEREERERKRRLPILLMVRGPLLLLHLMSISDSSLSSLSRALCVVCERRRSHCRTG